MSTICCLKERNTLILATDSRFMAADFTGIATDAAQKIFEIAPGSFIATSGRKMACDFQHARARDLAVEMGTTDIDRIGKALERESLSCLMLLVVRLRSQTDERTRQVVSGQSLLHGCVLAGRRADGKLGYISQAYKFQEGSVVCETGEHFGDQRGIVCTSGAPLDRLAGSLRWAQDPAIWTDSPASVVRRILGEMKRTTPESGGPDQIVCLDHTGAHWIARPPEVESPLTETLASANISALVSMNSPTLNTAQINASTMVLTVGGNTITISPSVGIQVVGGGYTTTVNNTVNGGLTVESGSYRCTVSALGITATPSSGASFGNPMSYMQSNSWVMNDNNGNAVQVQAGGQIYLYGSNAGLWINGTKKI